MEIDPDNISFSRTDRKIIERNRRNQMKALYFKLNSLIPHYDCRKPISLPDQLGEAANYIKKLQTNLERMKEKRDSLRGGGVQRCMNNNNITTSNNKSTSFASKSPQIQIHEMGSSFLVIGLTTESNSTRFIFNDIIRILHEEGADIVNASFSIVDSTAFHTIHVTVDFESAAVSRISERLNKFIHDANA